MRLLLAAVAIAVCSCSDQETSRENTPAKALGIELTGRVVDVADVLPQDVETQLSARLASLEAQTSDQLVVVTLPNLKQHEIEDVSLALGRGWGIGRSDLDNGVLLVVAPNDRKVRIEVGYGLEGLLTDERAGRIIRMMLPEFRRGDLVSGVEVGVQQIDAVLRSNPRRPQYRSEAAKRAA